ncbi:ATP-dependent helicase [Saccharopolyspora rectivirgula]|uniref:DNA 3'-5' helicase n=1 Tax=Saccharopolyspora rectivirgula TaxID=28042 RepID=A0A073AW63_9PSEU|nr:ATP-dependent DNA helicase [Saccharopolyspora rectivirgula]KEI43322.1 ATP-dependent DNA helicase [Saccharopolyspora rectivirgula]
MPVLVRRAEPRRRLTWDATGRRVLEHTEGFLRLLGGPGTGKTTLLAEVAAERMLGGVSPENVLVLTAGREAAKRMRVEITRRLADAGMRTAQEPLVRTVHSYAFGVLRLQAAREDLPPPQLLNGPDQDAQVRELLEGDVERGAPDWPESLRPALTVPGFAEELRDLLLRATERGVGPERLIELGEQHNRPEWIAAGKFARQYEQVTLLRGMGSQQAPALDAAELIVAALDAFRDDPDLLAAEQRRVRYLLVDDAQHLDPRQYELVRELGDAATEFILAGDPDQAVYAFRGADPRCLLDADPDGSRTEVLTVDHRMSDPVRQAVHRLAHRLPGTGPQRTLTAAEQRPGGSVQVRLWATAAQEASWVADQLRRAHLLEGVAWSDMAVLVRSTGESLPVLRRALLSAGVPVVLPVDDVPLAKRTAVRPFLLLLRAAARPGELTAEVAEELLASPLGGADPLALRRLRRGLRRLELASGGARGSGELLVEVLLEQDRLAALEDSAAEPARRVGSLLRTARDSVAAGHSVEETLWKVWKASGLEQRWVSLAERGGVTGAQADRDLDAIVSLFDAAAQYVDKWPGADVATFADYLDRQQIAGSSLAPTAPRDNAVQVLTAHAASGQEWEVVAIPGVQEGVWPDLRLRGSLLGVERLIDVLSGVDDSDRVSATAPLLAEERRLLLVAVSRARRRVLVSAVRGEDEQPSRFLDELEGIVGDPEAVERPVARPQRGLALADLVGELRRVVCDPEEDRERRQRASVQLARLARAGVPGADPDTWYGVAEPTCTDPLVSGDEPVPMSPSTVDVLAKCPLRWLLERHGGQDAAELASVTGTLVHALVQAAADGADDEQLRRALDAAWESVDAGAPWFSRRERKRVEQMLDSFRVWLARTRQELTQAGVEKDLDISIPARDGGPWLRLRGRVDRLEVDSEGRPVVVDIKTSKTPVSKGEAEQHPQLAVYQLAAALGAFGDADRQPGGARLLYVAKSDRNGAATEREQPALDQEQVQVWLDVLHSAAADSVGPAYLAKENSDCARCPAQFSCPVHPAGRQVVQ